MLTSFFLIGNCLVEAFVILSTQYTKFIRPWPMYDISEKNSCQFRMSVYTLYTKSPFGDLGSVKIPNMNRQSPIFFIHTSNMATLVVLSS